MTLGYIAEWILKNRRKTAFINYTLATVLDELTRCSSENTMVCATDEEGQIVGVATGKINAEGDKLYIYNILTTKPGTVKKMLQWFKQNYPCHTIDGHARGVRYRKFNNLDKLVSRIK
jgi:hypothetical protein